MSIAFLRGEKPLVAAVGLEAAAYLESACYTKQKRKKGQEVETRDAGWHMN